MANASLFSPANPHFFQPLLSGFQSHLKLPVKFFSKHIEGNYEGKTVTLTSDSSERTWKVKMEGHSLTDGWKEFVKAHDLRIGDFVVFRHEGDMLFHVTALGTGFCEILYAPSLSHDKDEESDEIGESSRKEKDLKTESDQSSSDLTCFSLSVTASNLSKAAVGVPVDFARRNGLDKGRHEIVLMNQEGMSWESEVKSSTSGQVFICRNWKSFCTASKLEVGDSFTFQVLQNTKTPVFQLCCRAKVERKKKIQYVHKTQKKKKIQYVQSCDKDDDQDNMRNLSTKQNVTTEPDADDKDNMAETESFSSDPSCFVALITISNLGEDRLFLPRKFVRPDGLKKSSNKISLINEEARIWTLILKFRESTRTFNMRSGWRSFCRENGLKPGDSVTFKLERTNTRTPLLRFSSAESKKVSTKYSSKGKRKETGESSQRVSSSSLSSSLSESRFVTLTVTPASFKHCSLYLPKSFTRDNGMENAEGKKVTLLDKHGVEWPVNLVMLKRNRRMHLGSGLKEFLKAIGVKAYKSFVLELVWEDTTSPPMLKFCSMVKT